jgi:hypothetical protein
MPSRGGVIRIAGLLFVVTFVAAFLVLGEAYGSFGDSDEWFAEYYESDREGDLVGAVLMAIAAAAFCVFAVRTAEGGSPTNRTLLTIALSCFAVMMLASAASIATIPATRAFGSIFADDGQATSAYWLLPQLAYVLLGAAGLAAACSLLLVTLGGTAPQLPRLGYWSGVVIGVLLFTSVVIVPLLLLPLWVFVASIWHGVSSEA